MNRRKVVVIFMQIIFLLASVYLVYKILRAAQSKEKLNTSKQYLPSIELRKIDGSIFQTDSFKKTKKLLVINYFNPDCDHCQNMVHDMFRERAILKDVNWLMITSNTREKTKRFADSMNLSKLPGVTVLNDTALQFIKAFGTVSVPSFYVYNNGTLLRKHSGECSIAYLLQP
ncbi:redoxin domain-containing protein [Lacibacter sp. MH-610]|uniref:peroxiredoxin family protein n=1 Tax=Lacibacter sp. MH-610 TaxID=3020883 RepID=UPI0038918513